MSPEPAHPERFGRTPAAAARAGVLLALLGSGAVLSILRYLTRRGTPLGDAFATTGIPPVLIAVLGVGAAVGLAIAGCFKAVRTAEVYRVTPEGFVVEGALGRYVLRWENVARAGEGAKGALGFVVRDRGAVAATHRGTEQQREWLRTMEPFGEWDFLYPRADLGVSAARVLEWMKPYQKVTGE